MRIAITSNGPGEFAGWVRPLVTALYRVAPDADVTLFFVPDDYATGREPDVARVLFPHAHVIASKEYLRFALGARVSDVPEAVDVVQYLGGDVMHAARVHGRLGGRASAYKFARKRDAKTFARAYALDDANAAGHREGRLSERSDRGPSATSQSTARSAKLREAIRQRSRRRCFPRTACS